jgi:OOP family OmpA-OmpF porin
MTLSQARAEAVRDYLMKRGVEASRLQAVGYGRDRPADRNNTQEGRAKNRRVELIVVEQ